MHKPFEPKNSILMPCICETEFIELNREEFHNEPAETFVTIYHCNTNIDMTIRQKLSACWAILKQGRALIYDVILTDKDLANLKVWLDRQPLGNDNKG